MNVNAANANTAYRLDRVFKNQTYIILQVRGGANLIISHTQDGALNGILQITTNPNLPADGLLFNSATTSPPSGVPYDFFWSGELWWAVDIAGEQWQIEIGTETSQFQQNSALRANF